MRSAFLILWVGIGLGLAQATRAEDLLKIFSPEVVGHKLIIKGKIDSHIYDFLSRAGNQLDGIQVVELNSYGGAVEWAHLIAQKIQAMNVTTKLSRNSVCASACLFLFAAGRERIAVQGTWFGVHGARLSQGLAVRFEKFCFVGETFSPEKTECGTFMATWLPLIERATDQQFAFLEANNISSELRRRYLSLPDQADWYERDNLLKKPDYVVSAEEAYHYNLVTRLN